ncbi:NAD-dependent epimerase/dehydratase family protein [Paracoccus sp. P2]|uniref:NAD-dependent epimerase/dehydratase family protein n=1 Tax=Paracoccus pantotrophus TaxID=82367 RepID=A0A1I5EBB4_PARPN|nr:NAD-dependent epimerase/dehydratase family protein [Paracoccus pantotrophus]MDF3853152.1 NAD-dependent epimerase/dehydratase family protein [Paracoccus pantotrophus]QFG36942.1 NAD-dependent epimerase/dehydratase family protein [Paracoccus pantotrophus]QLH14508.1 NAD-dependent epimerase/dehydratase family protein [Paracoccus pantotrophus]RDD94109.1 NAD-dependent epimerase/dehydratase family protein [Paracoccus pantotrophus]RKS52647.1 UDP-glucose 4-epimerase [Paracoccus pantotrophus]
MQRKALVTGGAGFIGSHLVDRLLAAGEEVVVLDDLSSGRADNLPPQVRLVRGDVCDADLLGRLLAGVDCIFHLAARVSVQLCISDWMGAHRVNLGGTIAVLHAAHRAGNIPVVHASSAAIYGNRAGATCRETDLPLPISPYAADKLAAEHQAAAMAEVHGLPSVGLRFFNVYGPRQDAASPYAGVISKFCANRLADRPQVIFGDGQQSRDFICVADVVEGLLRARDLAGQAPGAQVFNLCTGTETTLLELVRQIDAIAGRGASAIEHAPARSGDIRASCGCPQAARDRLGFAAATDMRSGLDRLWDALVAAG